MALLRESDLLARGSIELNQINKASLAMEGLHAREDSVSASGFDVFLSHSSNESKKLLAGIKKTLESFNFSVYIDLFDDPQLSLANVNIDTANTIKSRMKISKSLVYVYSSYSTQSRWMPWELGYFDGLKGKVGILPTNEVETTYKHEEYLALYPHIDLEEGSLTKKNELWINESTSRYAAFRGWIDNKEKIRDR